MRDTTINYTSGLTETDVSGLLDKVTTATGAQIAAALANGEDKQGTEQNPIPKWVVWAAVAGLGLFLLKRP